MKKQGDKIRTMGGSGYKVTIAVVVVLAAALLMLMLILMPAMDTTDTSPRRVVNIEYPEGAMGRGVDISKLYVKVYYDKGEPEDVWMSDLIVEGLDIKSVGKQNVSFSYGGFEKIIPVEVKNPDCIVTYTASTGGRIEGELLQSVPIGESANKVIARPDPGYIFVGWEDGHQKEERKDTGVVASGNHVATFEKAVYTVVFRYPDLTVAREQKVIYNEAPSQIPIAEDPKMQKYGYVFTGTWTLPYDHVTSNMTIDPIFVKYATDVSVEVTRDSTGATLGETDLSKDYSYYPKEKEAKLLASPYVGRSFYSWQIKDYLGVWHEITVTDVVQGTNIVHLDIGSQGKTISFTSARVGDSVNYELYFTPESDTEYIEIKANFVYDVSTITFINSMNSKDGNIERRYSLNNGYEIGAERLEPLENVTGYEFLGWYYETGDRLAASTDTFTQPTVLIARWRKIYSTVDFLYEIGGNSYKETVYVLYQNALSSAVASPTYENTVPVPGLPTVTPSKDKYIFDGWYLLGDGGFLTDTVVDESYKISENIEVRAKFTPITFNLYIEIVGNGNVGCEVTEPGLQPEQIAVIAGVNSIQQISSYEYFFTASEGYCIESVDNNGIVTQYGNNTAWARTQVSYPSSDRVIRVTFIPKTFVMTVINGDVSSSGNISYLEKSGSVYTEKSTDAELFYVSVEYMAAKNIFITPRDTHYLQSITIGNDKTTGFSKTTKTHTVTVPATKMTDDFVIIVEYVPHSYTVDLNSAAYGTIKEVVADGNGGYIPSTKQLSYAYGDSPAFMVEANPSYYAKVIKVNGKKVDIYAPESCSVHNIYVNGTLTDAGISSNDPRITAFVLVFDSINDDYSVEVEYAEIYYNITLSKTGTGTLDCSKLTVSRGESVQVYAETGNGYYVFGYVLNGVETVFTDIFMSRPINLMNITSDITLVVSFVFKTHVITFSGTENVKVTANGITENIPETYGIINDNSGIYILEAASGYYIKSVTLIQGGVQTALVVPHNAPTYECRLDNVLGNIEVEVLSEKISYNVTLNVNNSSYGTISYDGGAYGASATALTSYGGSVKFDLSVNQGYEIIASPEFSVSGTELTINNVTENKNVTVQLAVSEYTITVGNAAGGTVTAPAKAKYNEIISIVFAANIDENIAHILNGYTVNGAVTTLAEEYSLYVLEYLVTGNTTVSAEFGTGASTTKKEVEVETVVSGQSTSSTLSFGDASYTQYLVKPQDNYEIESIRLFDGASWSDVNGVSGLDSYILELSGAYTKAKITYKARACTVSVNDGGTYASPKIYVGANSEAALTETTDASFYDYVRIVYNVINPAEYEVVSVRVNGVSIIFGGTYAEFTCNAASMNVEITYQKKKFSFTGEISSGEGFVTADKSEFIYGDALNIRVVPRAGYELTALRINSVAVTAQELALVKSSMAYGISAGSGSTKGNLLVQADFQPISYWVYIETEGDGTTDRGEAILYPYGATLDITLRADDNNYIDGITIDGVWIDVDSSNLRNYLMNSVTQKYTEGIYGILITKSVTVRVHFKKNVYNISLLASVNGETRINLYAESQNEGAQLDITTVEHGRAVQINMEAAIGYNIAHLYINNVEITGFKNDNQNANNNRKLSYIYRGADGNGVATNLLIRVDYVTNSYSIGILSVNDSPNFKAWDTSAASFGTINVNGYSSDGEYISGIAHGDDFIININPVREKGYVITAVYVVFNHPTQKLPVRYDASALVGSGTAIAKTGAAVFFSVLMAVQGMSYMACDIDSLEVHFTRESFSYSEVMLSSADTGSIYTTFYHPNDTAKTYTVGSGEDSGIVLIDGDKLEYGLGYNIYISPSYGYSRTAFEISASNINNGAWESRENAVRVDVYTGILQSEVSARVEYKVNRYTLSFSFTVYNEFDSLIDFPGSDFGEIALIIGQDEYTLGANETSITIPDCAYNSVLTFVLRPKFSERGYYISSFSVAGITIVAATGMTSEYSYTGHRMPNSSLTAYAQYRIMKYNADISYVGSDGLSYIENEANSSTPWGRDVTMRVATDSGYTLNKLLVTKDGATIDYVAEGLIRNGISSATQQRRDYFVLSSVKENVVIVAEYSRKEFEIKFSVNDPSMGDIKLDIADNPAYPEIFDVSPTKSEVVSDRTNIYYSANYYDKLRMFLLPKEGYEVNVGLEVILRLYVYELVDGSYVEKTLTYYSGGTEVPYIVSLYTYYYDASCPDNLRVELPYEYVSANMEITFNFQIKGYYASVSKTPINIAGVDGSTATLELLGKSGYVDFAYGADGVQGTADDYYIGYFSKIRISVSAIEGLSLDRIYINGGVVLNAYDVLSAQNTRRFYQDGSIYSYSTTDGDTYTYSNTLNNYTYVLELTVNDSLLYDLLVRDLRLEVQFRVNRYNVSLSTYDTKSGTASSDGNGHQITLSAASVIAHNNSLEITPTLKTGYTVSKIEINGQPITITNMNARYSESINNFVSALDVHDVTNNTVTVYYETSIIFFSASIRSWVYEYPSDGYSDAAGITTMSPANPHLVENGVEKYEYFTIITVTATARNTYNKNYRFSHFEEQYNNTWVRVQHGQRGITLYNNDLSGMLYTVNNDGVNGDRIFRVVYYRVLTVTVNIMPEYKYADGYYTPNNTLRYLPYLTVSAMVNDLYLTDLNPENTHIYENASNNGTVPYVTSYTYNVDSGKTLRLFGKDNVEKNISSELSFYYRSGSGHTYIKEATMSSVGKKIEENWTFYLAASNETLISYSIETIENTSGTVGGSVEWRVIPYDPNGRTTVATPYRGSINTAKVLDRVELYVSTTTNYRFDGLYIRNVDWEATKNAGYLIFRDEGSAGETWTLIENGVNDYITYDGIVNGRYKYTIFLTENIQFKLRFYREFEVSYAVDYQEMGSGSEVDKLVRVDAESLAPNRTLAQNKEVHDYNSFITLQVPYTTENYQFIGWYVNGENLYRMLETEYPSELEIKRTFRFYQNTVEGGITDGLELTSPTGDVYKITIVAVYQPIITVAVIDEFYYFNEDDRHWNSWRSSSTITAHAYQYFTAAQVQAGESATGRYAVSPNATLLSAEGWTPTAFMTAMNETVPERVLNPSYYETHGNTAVWSQLKKTYDSYGNEAYWNGKEVYSQTKYFRMLLQHPTNIANDYNAWNDNVLSLFTRPLSGTVLLQWEYYDWSTGKFVTIEYVSEEVMVGSLSDYNNKAAMDSYYINFAEYYEQMDGRLDLTKPFIVRPKFQKKVELVLTKKAYTSFYGDDTTGGNSSQNPAIVESTGTNVRASFNYDSFAEILPYAGSGYRFIDWYFGGTATDGNYVKKDRELISGDPNSTQTVWVIPLRFEYGAVEQNTVRLEGRYIRQYTTNVSSKNIAGGNYMLHDAPKISADTITGLSKEYDSKMSQIAADDWNITVVADAGLSVIIMLDRRKVGNDDGYTEVVNSETVMGYNPYFDKQFKNPGESSYFIAGFNISNDTQNTLPANDPSNPGETTEMTLKSYIDRTVRLDYESFGEVTFTGLMWNSGIQLSRNLSLYLRTRWPGIFGGTGSEPIVLSDAQDYSTPGVVTAVSNANIDGTIVLKGIPIRNIRYASGGQSAESYNYVPYGFDAGKIIQIDPTKIGVTTHNDDTRQNGILNAAFDASHPSISKKVSLDYIAYDLFALARKPLPETNTYMPGSASNPYIIGGASNRTVQSPNAVNAVGGSEAYRQLRNIDTFYYWNGTFNSAVGKVHLKLNMDVTLAQSLEGHNKNAWIPLCWQKNGLTVPNEATGFDGVFDGGGHTLISFNINETNGKTYGASDTAMTTRYNYAANGYGFFFSIVTGADVKNIRFGASTFAFGGINIGSGGAGLLASRIRGRDISVSNIVAAGNISITGAGSYVGFIAGRIIGLIDSTNVSNNTVKISNIIWEKTFTTSSSSNYGVIAGWGEGFIGTNLRISAGTVSFRTGSASIGGLFGTLISSKLENCGISGGSVTVGNATNAQNAGGIAGTVTNSDLVKCYISTSISVLSGSSGNTGALVGDFKSGTISEARVTARITARGYNVGLIAGLNGGTVKDTEILGTTSAGLEVALYEGVPASVGGLVGRNSGTITNSGYYRAGTANTQLTETYTLIYMYYYLSGTTKAPITLGVTATDWQTKLLNSSIQSGMLAVGGIAGYNSNTISKSYLVGAKILTTFNGTGKFMVSMGGIVGYNEAGLSTGRNGVYSCFTRANSLLVAALLRAQTGSGSDAVSDSNSGTVTIGGIAGSTGLVMTVGELLTSVRECYALRNHMNFHVNSYGETYETYTRTGIGIDIFAKDGTIPKSNEYSQVYFGAGGIVGSQYYLDNNNYICHNDSCSFIERYICSRDLALCDYAQENGVPYESNKPGNCHCGAPLVKAELNGPRYSRTSSGNCPHCGIALSHSPIRGGSVYSTASNCWSAQNLNSGPINYDLWPVFAHKNSFSSLVTSDKANVYNGKAVAEQRSTAQSIISFNKDTNLYYQYWGSDPYGADLFNDTGSAQPDNTKWRLTLVIETLPGYVASIAGQGYEHWESGSNVNVVSPFTDKLLLEGVKRQEDAGYKVTY